MREGYRPDGEDVCSPSRASCEQVRIKPLRRKPDEPHIEGAITSFAIDIAKP
jgi:hypothetical protein